MSELKPCPFCGGEPTIIVRKGKDGWRDRYSVLCDYENGGCGAESGWYHYEVEAIEAWNHRAEQGQTAKAAELKRELERVKQERDAAVKDLDALRKKTGWKCDCCYYNDNYNRDVCTGCEFCKHCFSPDETYPTALCTAKNRIVNSYLNGRFCRVFELKEAHTNGRFDR